MRFSFRNTPLTLVLCGLLWACAAFGGGSASGQFQAAAPQHEHAPAIGLTGDSDVVATLLAAPRPPLTLLPGDEIQIEIFEIARYQYKTRLNTDGTVGMPLVKSISVGGLTAEQAEQAIAHRLQNDGMVNDPHVQVSVLERPSQVITVTGDVTKPGVFPAFGSPTLLSVLAQAQGLRDVASRTVTLIRPVANPGSNQEAAVAVADPAATGGVDPGGRAGATQAFTLNLGADPALSRVGLIPVYAGDTITVGTVGVVYVVGAVKLTGVYKLKTETPTTAAEAVAMAGGAGFEGITDRAEIVRTIDGKRTEIPFNYYDAVHHAGPDPVLMADDIVFIPTDKMRAALKGGGLGIAVALASAFLYRE